MAHFLSLCFSVSAEPSFFFRVIVSICALGMSASFGFAGVLGVFVWAASGWRFDHHTPPLRAARIATAIRRFRGFILSPFHKDRDAAQDDQEWDRNQVKVEECVHLPLINVEPAILRRLRSNRD